MVEVEGVGGVGGTLLLWRVILLLWRVILLPWHVNYPMIALNSHGTTTVNYPMIAPNRHGTPTFNYPMIAPNSRGTTTVNYPMIRECKNLTANSSIFGYRHGGNKRRRICGGK